MLFASQVPSMTSGSHCLVLGMSFTGFVAKVMGGQKDLEQKAPRSTGSAHDLLKVRTSGDVFSLAERKVFFF